MSRTRVKICGVTSAQDATLAVNAGVDAIGLIFHPSASRSISLLTAEQIIAVLPPFVTPVGLFLDCPAANVISLASKLHLSWIQLHGHETAEVVQSLAPLNIIKAIHVKPGKLLEALAPWHEACAKGLANLRGLVLETGWVKEQGGTGVENDWAQIQQAQADGAFNGLPPLIVAGGLRPSNVAQVIITLHPLAVDVSSGVEEVKGRKSRDRVSSFMRAVRNGDRSRNLTPSE